jgi:hypothetical protein
VEYGVRDAKVADEMIAMARRVSARRPGSLRTPPGWTAAARDVLLAEAEAEATLAQVHGFRLIPSLVQAEGYFRSVAPKLFHGCDPGQEWDLLAHRQAHQPTGVTRLLEVIIDENARELPLTRPDAMAGQMRHLLDLADSPHASVRVIPKDALFYESRGHQSGILAFAGTTDRIGVSCTVLGYELESGEDLHDLWTRIQGTSAADPEHSRATPEQHLATVS